jgi:Tol biopolymer transport system component
VVTRPGLAVYDIVTGRKRERLKVDVIDAAWSPAADQIAVSYFPASGELIVTLARLGVIESDQGPPSRIGYPWDGGSSIRFAWSPDGRQLVYRTCVYDARPGDGGREICQLVAASADGQNERGLSPGVNFAGTTDFVWSPDGGAIALGGDGGLYVFKLGSAKLTRVVRRPLRGFAWSPDGGWLAYTSEEPNAIQLVSRDGTDHKVLRDSTSVQYTALAWSPDGELIIAAASLTRLGPHLGLHVIDVRTGKVLHRTSGDDRSPVWRPR